MRNFPRLCLSSHRILWKSRICIKIQFVFIYCNTFCSVASAITVTTGHSGTCTYAGIIFELDNVKERKGWKIKSKIKRRIRRMTNEYKFYIFGCLPKLCRGQVSKWKRCVWSPWWDRTELWISRKWESDRWLTKFLPRWQMTQKNKGANCKAKGWKESIWWHARRNAP